MCQVLWSKLHLEIVLTSKNFNAFLRPCVFLFDLCASICELYLSEKYFSNKTSDWLEKDVDIHVCFGERDSRGDLEENGGFIW